MMESCQKLDFPDTTVNRAWGFYSSNRTWNWSLHTRSKETIMKTVVTPFSLFLLLLVLKHYANSTPVLEPVWIIIKMKADFPWNAALKDTGPRTLKVVFMFCWSIRVITVLGREWYPYSLTTLQLEQKMLQSVWDALRANSRKELVSTTLYVCVWMYGCMYICLYKYLLYNDMCILYKYTYQVYLSIHTI